MTKMNANNQMVIGEQDIVHGWLTGRAISHATVEDITPINIYNEWCNTFDLQDTIIPTLENNNADYVNNAIANWNMPQEYKDINIVEYLLGKTTNKQQHDRVVMELELFLDRGMEPVLKFLIYLVNICQQNDVVLGVGRGSSVASYCLYLIGIHCIDSIKYELDIKEFLK